MVFPMMLPGLSGLQVSYTGRMGDGLLLAVRRYHCRGATGVGEHRTWIERFGSLPCSAACLHTDGAKADAVTLN